MKTRKLLFLSLFVLILGTTACITDTIEGNGILATESRNAHPFDKVKSSGSFDVFITKGDSYEVIVSAEENVIPFIETHVSEGILNIDIEDHTSIRNDIPMEIFVTTPVLEGIKLSGSGLVTSDYFECNKMDIILSGSGDILTACEANKVEVSISGSGKVELSGNSKAAEFTISGSGNVEAANLATESCFSKISGSGDVWVSVDQYLKAKISGSGNVFYYGNPELDTNISGSGKILRQQ